jgi:DNA invertase Pin-like site-specific DNA recombinase
VKDSLPTKLKLRCAVYTRKSSEEGLDQEFNSLDAQRESCEAYIVSQRAECWVLVPDRYDDGGVSGATLERPALKRLLADIEANRVDVIVVYKIDRLSRALMDFARLVEVFDRNNVTFVSITQSFNTTTSMGRLTLNILLSFAQFEREVIGERIRDKFAASRRKGIWMGGWAPLGYDIKERKLIVNDVEADLVRSMFTRFSRGTPTVQLIEALAAEGALNKQGKPIEKGYLYRILNNRVYLGEAMHKGISNPGEHRAIIEQDLWDQVHNLISASPHRDGLRAQYWLSPEEGDAATNNLIELLRSLNLQAVPTTGLRLDNTFLNSDAIALAMSFPSAKIWIAEKQLRNSGEYLCVPRWALSEADEGNPRLWRWTPRARFIEIKTAWITPSGTEWVSEGKKTRAQQIHKWGFS